MARSASRSLFSLVWLAELLLVLVLAAVLAAWVWSGTQGSLATLLREAPGYLPAGQSLEAEAVQGSLRQGGRIGLLRWRSGALTVTAREVRIDWSPLELLRRRLQVDRLAMAELLIDDQRPASADAATPPPEVLLPLDVDLALALDRLRLTGATALEASALTARYRYQDHSHQIRIDSAQLAQGRYQGKLQLAARVPMALELQMQGQLQAPIDDRQHIALEISGSASGTLAGLAPRLDLQALIQPASGNRGPLAGSRATRAQLSAQINPWAAQPVIRAQASFSQLDLAALWPTAPRTLLTGNAWVRPAGPNWIADINLINRADGPWDKGRVPVASVRGLLEYGAGQLRIETLTAEAAGGQIRLQGSLADPTHTSPTSGWEGQLQLRGIDPALAHSKLEPIRLDGELSAAARQEGIDFDLTLHPAAQQHQRQTVLRGLRLQAASAKGRWDHGWLRLQRLEIRSSDAALEGRLALQAATRAASGELTLRSPGLQAQLSLEPAPRDGTGQLKLQLSDADATRRWLARLPIELPQLDTLAIAGNAAAELHWRGWQLLQSPGEATTIEASLTIPQLSLGSTGQDPAQQVRLARVDARLQGTMGALTLSASADMARGGIQGRLEAAATGGRDPRGNWRARVTQLRGSVRDSALPGPWTVTLQQPMALAWSAPTVGAAGGPTLQIDAAQASLVGPAPGTARLAWQPIRWQAGRSPVLTSKGTLSGLPMAWLTLFATDLASTGLSGDLVFDGQWDLTLADTLALRASLGRRSGDLRLQSDAIGTGSPAAAGTVTAGIRVLQLELRGDGNALGASFRWDSERAGNARIDFGTRLSRGQDGWQWSPDSSIAGTVRAQMPQLGVWSLLAPPGWRVRGTVDASLELSGTRRAPHWAGTLEARELALRSVVDGIEFGNGQLRATLQGQRLRIDQFSLQGAGGKAGGELTATGFAQWRPATDGAGGSALAAIDLQVDAVAKALRVSARADRRLAVSGTLQAALRDAALQVRGRLTVDQALFILPDESAPSLGADVVILGRAGQGGRNGAGGAAGHGEAGARTQPAGQTAAGKPSQLRGDLLVALDLGSDFKVRGRGIDTRIAGALELRSTLQPQELPRVTGTLRTVGGQYKAYGQQLEIEHGLMRFTGPYDNPALDILAIRPKLTQRVGVQVTGSALLPRVRLYAEPDLPEAEKLAWLVLGRSAANGGAEAAVLQQAAMALLGGQDASGGIAGRLGLDELSIAGSTDNTGATSATLTLGKRIAQNFYVTYEHSLAGTLGAFSIFYDLSDRFTLRARTGERSAIDLIFTVRYE